MKYLELYKKWALSGKIEHLTEGVTASGLCYTVVKDSPYFDLFKPTETEKEELAGGNAYWASEYTCDEYFDLGDDRLRLAGEPFTPNRQNIVLFIAFMEGETL
jgi:hypothetical protein